MAVPIRDDLQHFHRSSGGCHALRREQIRERQRQNKHLCRRAQVFQPPRVNDDPVALRLSEQRRPQSLHITLAPAFHPNDRRIPFLSVMLCPRSRFFPCDP
mgnify:CR=1 FL=1